MKGYREQHGCHDCKHVFKMYDWDECTTYYCTYGAPPRPPCGSVAMDETWDCEGFEEGLENWLKWAEPRQVKAWGICDKYEPEAEDADR